jgi:NAD(P)-dependent dehydrogenase (short-subunit alcohol dehydrogenase family)
VLITGASRGLGLDLARLYAKRGDHVAICARDPDELERVRRELEQSGGSVLAEVCDASDAEQVAQLVQRVHDVLGPIELLITCAATIQVGPVEHMTTQDFEEAMAGIFWTTYHPTMAVLPSMRQRREGQIVHVTSFGGRFATPHMLPYCAAKFAATGFSEGLRAELRSQGIRVTTITPGFLRTGAQVNAPFKGDQEKEFTWFAAGLTLPLLSLSSEVAAKRIARAAELDRAESTLTAGVRAVIIAKAMAPGLVSTLAALHNRLLPKASSGSQARRGIDVANSSSSKLVRHLERLGRKNAQRHNAYPGPLNVARAASQHDGSPSGLEA